MLDLSLILCLPEQGGCRLFGSDTGTACGGQSARYRAAKSARRPCYPGDERRKSLVHPLIVYEGGGAHARSEKCSVLAQSVSEAGIHDVL
ncbi:hypothetical protein [Streptomyces sp. NBC_01800]|uniref:hypothetical protein n=1 Tax=Streptomyces sp. NBC_01800 TaxID=2975945 RepID=UPI002DDA0CA4|nr:hypothetical protein [Streptomyces sp. NBC_01800]WSA74148.1 hypothetical protein OIE65_23320 [Streptomyces sp. NBC_01800]